MPILYYAESVRKFKPRVALWQPWGHGCSVPEAVTLKELPPIANRTTVATPSELRYKKICACSQGFKAQPWAGICERFQRRVVSLEPTGKTFLLFGGFGGRGEPTKEDTWEWDGAKWTQLALSGPSPRGAMGMAYHRKRKRVLFGGLAARRALGDTWEWDGKNWRQVSTAGPSARAGAQMVSLFYGKSFPHYPVPH